LGQAVVSVDALPGFDECLLHQILRHGAVTAQRRRLPQQPSPMDLDQFAEGPIIAGLGSNHEIGFIPGAGLRRF
jgi:hypothetical protein